MTTHNEPASGWAGAERDDHYLHLYANPTELVNAVRGFAREGLCAQSAVVMIATEDHLERFARALREDGIDLARAQASGQYVPLVASTILSQVLVDGWPQLEPFERVVGGVINEAKAHFPSVRAFGEMSGLLWGEGRYAAAVQLESLWNDLRSRNPFALFCAYPATGAGEQAEWLEEAHARDSHLVRGDVSSEEAIRRLEDRGRRLGLEIEYRLKLERALAERERELSDFLDNAAIALHKVDADGLLLWANRAELDMLGYRLDEYVGQPIARFHAEAEGSRLLERLLAGETLHDVPGRMRCKDGTIKDVLISSNGSFDNGKLLFTRCSTRDVTAELATARRMHSEAEKWEILYRTGTALAGQLDFDRLIATVTDAVVDLTGAAFGAFFYGTEDQSAGPSLPYRVAGAPAGQFHASILPRLTPLLERVFSEKCIVLTEDMPLETGADVPLPVDAPSVVRSCLAVPVIARSGGSQGALVVGHWQPRMFDHGDELIVGGIASQAAVAMENARLFQASQRAQLELKEMNKQLERRVRERTAALRESELHFEQLVNGVTDYAIYMLDPEGRIVSWNLGAQRIKGYEREEILGRDVSLFYTPEDRANDAPRHTLAIAASRGRFEAETWRVRKNGERFWASVVVNALHDESGKLIGYAKITRDLSERREMEEQLRQAQKMEAIGQLTGGVAHDFNNLLTVIAGNLETIWRLAPPEDARLKRAIDHASRGARRAATLTQQLLAFSRRQPLNPRPTDINRLVSSMSEMVRRTIDESISVETVLAGGLWRAEIDAHQLESALLNLALNARDAMPEGGKLTIETANASLDEHYAVRYPELSPGQYVLVSITDTGVGMTREVLARAFDPFFTTKPIGQGTGLGLSQVYGFVKQSGGHVKLYSEPGQGTTVKIYLPRFTGEVDLEPRAHTAIAPNGQRNELILVVEDDADVRAFTTATLLELGFGVLEAADADTALTLLEQRADVRLLFTDVGLPGMNGAQLVRKAREIRADLPVLFTTGYARNAIVHQGRLDAGVELLTKPFTRAQLACRIRDVLDRHLGQASKPRVLLIEDEQLVRAWAVEQLSGMGYEVIETASGSEAMQAILRYGHVDAVLIDRGLPDRDGIELALELRARLPQLKVIVASGYGIEEGDERLDREGEVRYLVKPYSAEALAETLGSLRLLVTSG
ncbi:MAG TPA: response regulator [Steroidobacteraceae bacterium]|jgi:PAS domain S-box-containing protein